jgi:hypothetical protein
MAWAAGLAHKAGRTTQQTERRRKDIDNPGFQGAWLNVPRRITRDLGNWFTHMC